VTPAELWHLRRKIVGLDQDGDLSFLSRDSRRLYQHLESLPVEARPGAVNGFACGLGDPEAFIRSLAEVNPEGPCPEASPERCATLAELRRLASDTLWSWKSWLAAGVLNALAADPGTGKTIMAVFLAWVLWTGSRWPDGQENGLPPRTRTLWVPGDRHFSQLLELAAQYGIPDEAMLFNAPVSDPTGGLDLDDPAEHAALEGRIEAERPGLVIIDTVGMTTSRNLCRPEDAREYFGPLMDMARATGVPCLCLTHLSRDGQALGRRINGACRVVWKMTDPDPDGQPNRRRVEVDKTFSEKPPALGMTIRSGGCTFDFSPPSAPEPSKGGRPPSKRGEAEAFILEALVAGVARIGNDLADEWAGKGESKKTFWRAVDDMAKEGVVTIDGGPGTRRQKTLRLAREDVEFEDAA
jgi:hypothetical protein